MRACGLFDDPRDISSDPNLFSSFCSNPVLSLFRVFFRSCSCSAFSLTFKNLSRPPCILLFVTAPQCFANRPRQTVVISAVPLTILKKLKFKREVSVTLVLKSGESKEYLTPQVSTEAFGGGGGGCRGRVGLGGLCMRGSSARVGR